MCMHQSPRQLMSQLLPSSAGRASESPLSADRGCAAKIVFPPLVNEIKKTVVRGVSGLVSVWFRRRSRPAFSRIPEDDGVLSHERTPRRVMHMGSTGVVRRSATEAQ